MSAPAGAAAPRDVAVDAARGLAVLAMVAAHFERVLSNQHGPRWVEALLQAPNGRAGALFVVLAGLGISLFVARDPARARAAVARRGLAIGALGYGFLTLWEADILHVLGLLLLAGAGLARASTRLLWTGIVLVSAAPFAFAVLALDPEQGWVLDRLEYVELWTWDGHLRHLVFNGHFPLYPWIALLLYGIWLGRRVDRVGRALLPALGVLVAAEVGGWMLGTGEGLRTVLSTSALRPGPLYVLSAGALATALLAVFARFPTGRVAGALAAVGRLSLTWYLLHVTIAIGIFDTFFQLGCLTLPQVAAWWALFTWGAVLGSSRWLARFGRGPAEAIVRSLTRTASGGRA